jgi:hypothetical protein
MRHAVARLLDEAGIADEAQHRLRVGARDLVLEFRSPETDALPLDRQPGPIVVEPHPHLVACRELSDQAIREAATRGDPRPPALIGHEEFPLDLETHYREKLWSRKRSRAFSEAPLRQRLIACNRVLCRPRAQTERT